MRSIHLVLTWFLLPLLASAANPPKVLIIYDMEGVSGVMSPAYERFGTSEME
jgi:hypothetical protein